MMDPMIQAKMDAAIRAALEEDMPFGDVSTMSVMPEPRPGRVQLIAKQDGVIAGLGVFARVFALIDPAVTVNALVADGDEVTSGQHLATVEGDVRVLLEGETKQVLGFAVLVYLLPLVLFFVGYGVGAGMKLGGGLSALIGGVRFVVGILAAMWYSHKLKLRNEAPFAITERL